MDYSSQTAQLRELQRRIAEAEESAGRFRTQRDRLIRQLRAADSQYWTYRRLARVVGCSSELVALIVRQSNRAS